MNILFAGTPNIAAKSLERVAESFRIVGVLTAPDSVGGRGRKVLPPPVKVVALRLGLTLLQPDRLDEEVIQRIVSLNPDILVVVAYGKIFRDNFLRIFPLGGINLHPSLLPKFRGPSPIPAVILAGERETGVTIQKIAKKVDSGDIIEQIKIKLAGDETTLSLTDKLSDIGADLLVRVLLKYERGEKIDYIAQNEGEATYCKLIKKEDGKIDWRESALYIDRMVRAYNPWPRAYTFLNGKTLVIHSGFPLLDSGEASIFPDSVAGEIVRIDKKRGILVKTGEGVYCITELQLQYKKLVNWKSFANGYPGLVGTILGGLE